MMADNWAAGINGGEDDDEALRIAIALSLGEDPAEGRPSGMPGGDDDDGNDVSSEVIDLTEEDGDGKWYGGGRGEGVGAAGSSQANAPSRMPAPAAAPAVAPAPTAQQPNPPASTPGSAPASVFAALGLDRKKMEEERLARLNKRKASEVEDSQSPARAAQRPRVTAASSLSSSSSLPSLTPLFSAATPAEKKKPAAPKQRAPNRVLYSNLPYSRPPPVGGVPSSPAATPKRETIASGAGAAPARPAGASAAFTVRSAAASSNGLPFPKGVVRKTWAYGQPRRGDDIKIEEVLQKQQLQMAVLSSYQWDEEWLLSKVDLARTRLILVAFAADEAQEERMRSNVPSNRIRFCFPPMHGIGAMHSKLMLLKYDKYMRIVVPTGNLMSFDWGETGTMENMVFIIDLPKIQSDGQTEPQQPTQFAEELFYFLLEQGLDDRLVASLRHYDFSETSRYQFVHTIAGSHTDEDAWKRTGYCGLGRAVGALGLETSDPLELDYVCASLGAVNYSLVTALYYACQGDSGLKEYKSRTSASKAQKASAEQTVVALKTNMRIFFPSRDTVLQSKGGKDGAGTICFQSKWWKAPTFPRELLRDSQSVRPGLLMHSKVLYVRPRNSGWTSGSPASRSFAYVGSANLSESAWGRLARDRASGKPRLSCRNWECGVLVPASEQVSAAGQGHAGGGSNALRAVFEGSVPVPMEWPGRAFAAGSGIGSGTDDADAKTPWFFSDR